MYSVVQIRYIEGIKCDRVNMIAEYEDGRVVEKTISAKDVETISWREYFANKIMWFIEDHSPDDIVYSGVHLNGFRTEPREMLQNEVDNVFNWIAEVV